MTVMTMKSLPGGRTEAGSRGGAAPLARVALSRPDGSGSPDAADGEVAAMQIRVNPIECNAHGVCAKLLPE